MKRRALDGKITQQNARAPDAEHAQSDAGAVDARQRLFADGFASMHNQAIGLGGERQQLPVEGVNLDGSASGFFEFGNDPRAGQRLRRSRA